MEVSIYADIRGAVRPVCGAEVFFGGKKQVTDEEGKAVFAAGDCTMEANAGSNFLPARMNIYV